MTGKGWGGLAQRNPDGHLAPIVLKGHRGLAVMPAGFVRTSAKDPRISCSMPVVVAGAWENAGTNAGKNAGTNAGKNAGTNAGTNRTKRGASSCPAE